MHAASLGDCGMELCHGSNYYHVFITFHGEHDDILGVPALSVTAPLRSMDARHWESCAPSVVWSPKGERLVIHMI